jgi:hypothetical protein
MRSLVPIACLLLLAAGCNAAPTPPVGPSPTSAGVPETAPVAPSVTPFVWEEFHSDDLFFSLQLPRGWTARRSGPSEGIVLRAEGGEAGSLVLTIDTEIDVEAPFQQIVNDYFRSIIEEDPNAVEALELPGGRAARATSPRDNGGVSVIYLFAPRGDHAKSLSFTWGRAEPNPLWSIIAERFNAYSSRPIVPFITPTP